MHIDFLILVKELEAANDPHDHLGLHKAIIFIKAEDFAFWQEKEKKRTKDWIGDSIVKWADILSHQKTKIYKTNNNEKTNVV